jgi:hypothetical protein
MPVQYRVEVQGIAPFVNRLEKFDKDVSKTLKKEMRQGANEVAKEARSLIGAIGGTPLSGWGPWTSRTKGKQTERDLSFNVPAVKKGIKVQSYRGRFRGATTSFGYRVNQMNPGGAIYELAGSQDKSGDLFNSNLNNKRGSNRYPRIMYRAYYAGMSRAETMIRAAIRKAEKEVGL